MSKNPKLQIFEKISKSNFSKTVKPKLLKFYMWVHVGHMFIHAKFHDPDGHRTAYMAKKPKFWIFWAFLEHFFEKNGS